MAIVGEGRLNEAPEPISVPPQLPVYQFKVDPDPPITERVIIPGSSSQKLFRSDSAVVGACGSGFTVISILAQVEFPQLLSHLA